MFGNLIMTAMEIIGTAAFAVSGALTAIRRGLDLFGVLFVGCVTAVGGGVVRDVLIGSTPPRLFFNTEILLTAVVTSAVVFVAAYVNRRRFSLLQEKVGQINNFFDALGLAAFTVTGTEIACTAGTEGGLVFAVVMGMITGVGGGIFRDILVDRTPSVLRKHIYALASLLGSLLYYLMRAGGQTVAGTFLAMLATVTIRMLAVKYRWTLPVINIEK